MEGLFMQQLAKRGNQHPLVLQSLDLLGHAYKPKTLRFCTTAARALRVGLSVWSPAGGSHVSLNLSAHAKEAELANDAEFLLQPGESVDVGLVPHYVQQNCPRSTTTLSLFVNGEPAAAWQLQVYHPHYGPRLDRQLLESGACAPPAVYRFSRTLQGGWQSVAVPPQEAPLAPPVRVAGVDRAAALPRWCPATGTWQEAEATLVPAPPPLSSEAVEEAAAETLKEHARAAAAAARANAMAARLEIKKRSLERRSKIKAHLLRMASTRKLAPKWQLTPDEAESKPEPSHEPAPEPTPKATPTAAPWRCSDGRVPSSPSAAAADCGDLDLTSSDVDLLERSLPDWDSLICA